MSTLLFRVGRILFGIALLCPASVMAQAANFEPRLSWQTDPSSSITITWDRATLCAGEVEYGSSTGLGSIIVSPAVTHRHRATISGLNKGSSYWYRVRSSDGYESALYTFRTAPTAEAPFTCVMFGDSRTNTNALGAVSRLIRSFNPLWIGHTGDLVENGTLWPQWVDFMAVSRDSMKNTVFMPSAGNHDSPNNPASFYFSLFSLPPNPASGRYYSFDVGCLHGVVLDTSIDLNGAQKTWLEADLQASTTNPAIAWTIVYFHRPPYSSGAHESQLDVRAAWCALFEKYGVDLVFSGHDHDYERSRPINGVTYVVTGGGGAPLYPVSKSWFTAVATSCYHAVVLDVEPARIRYRAVRSDGLVIEDLILPNTGAAILGSASRVIRPADFDGDGRDDLAVYNPDGGLWYVQGWSASNAAIMWGVPWGFSGSQPVPADYDGDGLADLAVYYPNSGAWYIYSQAKKKVLAWDFRWGHIGAVPVPGDYDGDQVADPAVYIPAKGQWYVIRLADSRVIARERAWGAQGLNPTPGDFDGDGCDDLGVYNPVDGRWYIQSLADPGTVLAWARQWGYSGALPLPGDYNGDGACDLAVYDTTRGVWFVVTLGGTVIVWNRDWGFNGAVAVPADYNGGGRTDLGIFYPAAGTWYLFSLGSSGVLNWNRQWGFPGAIVMGGTY